MTSLIASLLRDCVIVYIVFTSLDTGMWDRDVGNHGRSTHGRNVARWASQDMHYLLKVKTFSFDRLQRANGPEAVSRLYQLQAPCQGVVYTVYLYTVSIERCSGSGNPHLCSRLLAPPPPLLRCITPQPRRSQNPAPYASACSLSPNSIKTSSVLLQSATSILPVTPQLPEIPFSRRQFAHLLRRPWRLWNGDLSRRHVRILY